MNQQQEQLNNNKPLMWSEVKGGQVFVYHNGVLAYKRWIKKDGSKRQPSLLWNAIIGWMNEWII